MKSVQNPSLRGMTTELLKSLDAQFGGKARSGKGGRSAAIVMQTPGRSPSDANKVESLHKLAVLYHRQKKFEQAERLYQESLTLYSMNYGTEDPKVGQCLNNVGRLYLEEGWYAEAEALLDRSLKIVREHYGAAHGKVARRLTNLAELYNATNRPEEAAEHYQQAIAIEKKELGEGASQTFRTLRALAATLRKLNRIEEAEQMEADCHRPRGPERRLQSMRRLAAETTTGVSRSGTPISAGERRRRSDRRESVSRRQKESG